MDMEQWNSQTSADEDDQSTLSVVSANNSTNERPLDKPNKPGPARRQKKEKISTEMRMLQSLVDVVKQPDNSTETFSSDEDGIFGQFVVSEMRKITHGNTKLLLKQTITNALFQARLRPNYPLTQYYGTQPTSLGQQLPQQNQPHCCYQLPTSTPQSWH